MLVGGYTVRMDGQQIAADVENLLQVGSKCTVDQNMLSANA